MSYVDLGISTSPAEFVERAFDRLRTEIPGWEPAEGNLDVWLIRAVAEFAAVVRDTAAVVPATAFAQWGEQIVGLPRRLATSAALDTTWTLRDSSGYTIPAGAQVAVARGGGEAVAFEVRSPVVVAPGLTSATIALSAVEAGAEPNGLTPVAADLTLLDALDFVTAITPSGSVSGGQDAEDEDTYRDRLAAELRLLSPRPILASDFAVLARRVAGVARALAIDGYDPGPPVLTGQERTVSVAVVDSAGAALSSGVKAEVDALLEAAREVNFVVHVIDPTFTSVAVVFAAKSAAGYTPAAVETAAEAAVAAYLSPATWGIPPRGDDPATWELRDKVRYLEVAAVLNSVEGLDYVTSLTLNGGTADVTLSGAAPLPSAASTVAGTVTAP